MGDEPFEIPPPSGGGGGGDSGGSSSGGSSSGSSSSSSSSSSSAPAEPQDPYDAWYAKLAAREKKSVSILDQVYQTLWGEAAPLAVLQAAINQGLNRWEFEEAQKRNSAWWRTEAAEDQAYSFDLLLSQLGLGAKPQRKGKGGKGDGKKGGGGGYKPGDRYDNSTGFGGRDDGRPIPGGQNSGFGGPGDGKPNPNDDGTRLIGPGDRGRRR